MEQLFDRIRRLTWPGCILAGGGLMLPTFQDPAHPLPSEMVMFAKFGMVAGFAIVLISLGAQVGAWLASRRRG